MWGHCDPDGGEEVDEERERRMVRGTDGRVG